MQEEGGIGPCPGDCAVQIKKGDAGRGSLCLESRLRLDQLLYPLVIDMHLGPTERVRKPFAHLALARRTVYMTAVPLKGWTGSGTPGGRAV